MEALAQAIDYVLYYRGTDEDEDDVLCSRVFDAGRYELERQQGLVFIYEFLDEVKQLVVAIPTERFISFSQFE
ncbi:MAG: hypothetical protein Pars93KO_19730 [Parasphingorhabdus sp.]